MYKKCPLCKGKGLFKKETCPVCLGEHIINKKTGLPPSKYVAPITWPTIQSWWTPTYPSVPTIIYTTPGTSSPGSGSHCTQLDSEYSTLTLLN